MIVVVGLGNPGTRYEKTRHNVGFRVIDQLAERFSVKVRTSKFRSLIGECFVDGRKILLVKPQTYMNLSGEAVREVISYYDVAMEDLIVIYDDIDLPLGSLRIRKSGGPGTHNGMRSVVDCVGSRAFPRIRIGIGSSGRELVDHVIGKVPKDEQQILSETEHMAAEAVIDMIKENIDIAMNKYNIKKASEEHDN